MDEKQMLQNLMEGRKREHERFKKYQDELWKHPDDLDKLEDVLKRLKKHELDEIRKTFDFKGLSALNKGNLAEKLADLIPQHYDRSLYLLDQERYQLVKRMVKNNGRTSGKRIFIRAIMKYALAFPANNNGERVLVLPDKLMDAFQQLDSSELKQIVEENTEWIKLTRGMLEYYGYIDYQELIKKIETYTGKKVDVLRFFQVMSAYRDYEDAFDSTYDGYADFSVFDVKELKAEQEKRPEISYYPFTKQQLLKAGSSDTDIPSDSMNPFIQIVRENYDIEEEELKEVAYDYESLIKQGEGINELMEEFQEQFEIPTKEFAQKLADTLVYANNNTRSWLLKGYKPMELSGNRRPEESSPEKDDGKVVPFKQSNKVKRNEPCPCGSGKKYKKCCGVSK